MLLHLEAKKPVQMLMFLSADFHHGLHTNNPVQTIQNDFGQTTFVRLTNV